MWNEDDEHAINLKAIDDTVAQKAAAKGKPPSIRSIGRPRGSKDSKPRKTHRQGVAGDGSRLACSHDAAAHDEFARMLVSSAAAPPALEEEEEEEEALYRHFPFFLQFALSDDEAAAHGN